MKIIFVTGNKRKIGEASAACKPFGIEIDPVNLDTHEIQHHDPVQISKQKALEAFKIIDKPLVVNDASWLIPALNGFPGGYMKDVTKWFSAEDFITLVLNKPDRRICLVETIVYKDRTMEKIIQKEFWGEISKKPKGSGNSMERVVAFDGKTIGQYREAGQYVIEPDQYIWNDFAKWHSNRKRD